MFTQRPSALLGICDPYVAYCLDEAAAELLSHREAPSYPEDKDSKNPMKNDKVLKAMQKAKGVKINKKQED